MEFVISVLMQDWGWHFDSLDSPVAFRPRGRLLSVASGRFHWPPPEAPSRRWGPDGRGPPPLNFLVLITQKDSWAWRRHAAHAGIF